MAQPTSFLWYDYETWGIEPRRDGIAQFAAVRTDADLNIIGEAVDLRCKPLPDTLVNPEAALVTGLSPAECERQGVSEWDFAARIEKLMAEPGTCTVGYNSLRFDDEFSRHLFYRNLLDPYSREWRNGNSRWDLLDVVRLTHALRPEGIEWPRREDGTPSFRLEHLTAANGIEHGDAHDAVSDVRATIELARMVRRHQPKLFDYALGLRSKQSVRGQLRFEERQPHLHVSGRIPAARGCLTVELPLIEHPDRRNEIIVLDLLEDPTWLLDYNADQLRTWLYTPSDELPEGMPRVPFRTLRLNRCPMIAPYSLLDDAVAERWSIDRDAIARHQAITDRWHDLVTLARDVFRDEQRPPFVDPEHALYAGFIDDRDRRILGRIRASAEHPERWPGLAEELCDERQKALVFNARARHFPASLSAAESRQWQEEVRRRLTDPDWGASLTLAQAQERTEALLAKEPDSRVLQEIRAWLTAQAERWLQAESTDKAPGRDETEKQDGADNQTQLGLF